ncbi:MAG: serine hydrolase, partial [Halobaculum sp.]
APESLDDIENTMTPYVTEDGERRDTTFPVKGVGAAGGLVASARDLGRYLQFQMDPDRSVVDPDRLDSAHEAHTTRQTYLDGTEQGYGYGWMRRSLLDDTVIEHGGSLGVSTAYVGFLEDADLGVALACNDSPDVHPQFVGPALLALLSDENPIDATRFYGLRAAADRVTGEYESYRDIAEVTVERAGPRLSVSFETALSEQSFEAFPASAESGDPSYYTVESSGARVPLEFVETDDGMDLFYKRWRFHRTED